MRVAMRWNLPLLGLITGFLIGGSGACLAQNTDSGDLRGTATDSTGAVVTGVTVTLTDVDKGVVRTYVTDAAGLYDTGAIPPDHYLVKFSRDGFETYVRGPVTVTVGIQTVDATLQVGQVSQQVVVTTDVPMLNTESGALEGDMQSSTMSELPQVGSQNGGGADWENFVVLMPGAAGAPENQNGGPSNPGTTASINGNLPFQSYLQDGATTTLPMSQNSDVTIFDTTSEVKISVTAFSAQYGVGDIIYNQITKSGTNSFHGAAYDYLENNAFNAAPYNFGAPYKVPALHFNDFGGNIGGPVLRKKMFFFLDYDRTISHGAPSPGFSTEPTAAMMSGDFTGLPTLYDPTTQVIKPNGGCTYSDGAPAAAAGTPCVQRTSFASEYGNGNKIPANMISSVAQAIQKFYPKSNVTGELTGQGYYQNNFAYAVPSSNPYIKWFGRLDYDVTPNNRLTFAETESNNPGVTLGEGICPINCFSNDVSRDNASISDVWTLGSRFVNEARMGFTDQFNFFVPETLGKGYPALLGWQFAEANAFPGVSVNHFDGNLGSGTNSVYKEMVFDPSDVATMIRGRHVIHFGGEFLINRADSTAWSNINPGGFTFSGNYTSQGGSLTQSFDGFSYADFLLGQSSQWGAGVTPEWGGRWKGPQFFAQDDWKVKPNLTVNLGVRYEIETGWREVKGNEASWDPSVQNFNVSSQTINGIAPGAPVLGGMWYGFTGENGRNSVEAPKYDIVMPRFGFSWQIMPSMVIRGGIGMYTSTWSDDLMGGVGNAFGSSGGLNDNNTTNGLCPVVTLLPTTVSTTPNTQDPAPCGTILNGFQYNPKTIGQLYLTAPNTPWAQNGNGPGYTQYHAPVPTNYQYTLSVEREFMKDFVASVAYVGNHGDHENTSNIDINQVPANKLGQGQIATPYPLFSSIGGSTNNAISNYNSLQAVLTKRMSYGLQFSTNYTWSHFLDDIDSSGWANREGYQNYQNAYNISQNYSNSNFDIRQMFKGEVVYQLPFGKGKMFMNGSNVALDEALGGWEVSSTFVAQGGSPMGVTTGNDNTSGNLSGGYTQEAILTGNYKTATQYGAYHSLKSWFNDSFDNGTPSSSFAFENPADYPNKYGTFLRNVIYGPDLTEVNFAAGKSFDVFPERGIKFQFQAEANNILNHPSFAQPGPNTIGSATPEQITGTTVGGRVWQMVGHITF